MNPANATVSDVVQAAALVFAEGVQDIAAKQGDQVDQTSFGLGWQAALMFVGQFLVMIHPVELDKYADKVQAELDKEEGL